MFAICGEVVNLYLFSYLINVKGAFQFQTLQGGYIFICSGCWEVDIVYYFSPCENFSTCLFSIQIKLNEKMFQQTCYVIICLARRKSQMYVFESVVGLGVENGVWECGKWGFISMIMDMVL
eukprot:TRINITY_DN2960_c0_g1_i10.p1 TRINITY_DN2960_c0_g1~~TRINITY_DN2960_c0_g1_i10.p1  ORF type:complete len:121 (+),score=6.91 TRINITY_DN2960_c0_g1_i10:334-696(+)